MIPRWISQALAADELDPAVLRAMRDWLDTTWRCLAPPDVIAALADARTVADAASALNDLHDPARTPPFPASISTTSTTSDSSSSPSSSSLSLNAEAYDLPDRHAEPSALPPQADPPALDSSTHTNTSHPSHPQRNNTEAQSHDASENANPVSPSQNDTQSSRGSATAASVEARRRVEDSLRTGSDASQSSSRRWEYRSMTRDDVYSRRHAAMALLAAFVLQGHRAMYHEECLGVLFLARDPRIAEAMTVIRDNIAQGDRIEARLGSAEADQVSRARAGWRVLCENASELFAGINPAVVGSADEEQVPVRNDWLSRDLSSSDCQPSSLRENPTSQTISRPTRQDRATADKRTQPDDSTEHDVRSERSTEPSTARVGTNGRSRARASRSRRVPTPPSPPLVADYDRDAAVATELRCRVAVLEAEVASSRADRDRTARRLREMERTFDFWTRLILSEIKSTAANDAAGRFQLLEHIERLAEAHSSASAVSSPSQASTPAPHLPPGAAVEPLPGSVAAVAAAVAAARGESAADVPPPEPYPPAAQVLNDAVRGELPQRAPHRRNPLHRPDHARPRAPVAAHQASSAASFRAALAQVPGMAERGLADQPKRKRVFRNGRWLDVTPSDSPTDDRHSSYGPSQPFR